MRRLDWRKLLQWSWGDIPMLLAGLAALLSWASTPELRVETDLLQTTLEAARHSRCSERILAFNASMSAESASGLWRDTHIVPRVRMHCHAAEYPKNPETYTFTKKLRRFGITISTQAVTVSINLLLILAGHHAHQGLHST